MKFNRHRNESDVAPTCTPYGAGSLDIHAMHMPKSAAMYSMFLLIFKLSTCHEINLSTTSSYCLIQLYSKYMDKVRRRNNTVRPLSQP